MLITQPMQQPQMIRQRMQLPNRPDGSFVTQIQSGSPIQTLGQPQIGQMSNTLTSQTDQQNIALLAQRLAGEGDAHAPTSSSTQGNPSTVTQAQSTSGAEGASEIPDSVSAELEKLEQEDNTGIGEVEGVGDDILGGLGDDDDELLDSLTAEMGADFNILEYADPELDTTDGEKSNLLDSLELDEPEGEKSEDTSKLSAPADTCKSETMDASDNAVDDSKLQRPLAMTQNTMMATSSTVVTQQQLSAGVMVQSQQQMLQTQQIQSMQQQLPIQQQLSHGIGQQQQPTQLQQLISGGQALGPQAQTPPQQLQQQLLAGQMKTIRPLTPAHLQQIQQQMQQQVGVFSRWALMILSG